MASPSNSSTTSTTLNGIGKLIRVLPTGTVFSYQLLNPLLTNGGHCSTTNRIVSSLLFVVCGLSCFFSTFTDTYKDKDGIQRYGIATFKGFFPFTSLSSDSDSCWSKGIDFSSLKLQIGDFVHGLFALNVFAALSLLDSNTVDCFYPAFASNQKALLMALPSVLGIVSGTVFFLFPYKRHGIGYPSTTTTSNGSDDQSADQSSSPPLINGVDDQKVHADIKEDSNGDQKV